MKAQPQFYNASHFKTFWEKGNGKELLKWANVPVYMQDFDKYAPLYHEVDVLGDDAVRDTYLTLPYHEASSLVEQFSKSPVYEIDTAPASLKKLFLQMQQIPEWYDEDLANIGARFCMRTGTNALIILRDFTLMGGYDFAYLNKPLVFTGALKKGAVKRLKDTLEFWVNVTRENALKTNSEAYQLIVRTRLMHSYARLKIKEKRENWDYEKWGEPINSWDMIATYMGFSLVFMQGLKKLGIIISEEEEKGVFHLWKYIGYLLGIPPAFLPENRQQAAKQFYLWTATQDKGDGDSALLAKALLDENMESTILKHEFQRKNLRYLHICCNWFLLDEEINRRLKIPEVPFPSLFPRVIKSANVITQKLFPLTSKKRYQKLVNLGDRQQMKVLSDYLKHTPKDFHY
ncbi:MAG: DUF2236 domain-containing protein [Weeksellaceae bacterium]|nr:DUF2236 domain-containing protein [Weeksellaceae bacterium]